MLSSRSQELSVTHTAHATELRPHSNTKSKPQIAGLLGRTDTEDTSVL